MAKEAIVDLVRVKPKNINKRIVFELPVPPSINHMYIHKKNGAKILTKDAEKYVRNASALINQAIEEQSWEIQEKGVWVYVDLVFYFQDRLIRDSHNCIKLLFDILQNRISKNDYYIMPRIQSVEYDKANPRVELLISKQKEKDRQLAKLEYNSIIEKLNT